MKSHSTGDSEGTRKIKVVRIIDRLNIGGPARHVVWLTAGLDPERFETTLVTGTVPAGEGDMSYFASENGVEPIVIEQMSRELGARDVLVTLKLFRLLLKLRPHIVHTHKSKAGAAGRVAAFLYRWVTVSALILRPRRCKIVHTFHGHIFRGYYGAVKTRIFVLIERLLAHLGTDRILVLSEQQRQEICEEFKVGRPEQYKVIPLGIDLRDEGNDFVQARTTFRAELGAAEGELLIGIVGRLCEVKNHSMFLEAAARLVADGRSDDLQLRFVVIGDGHLRSELEARASQLGIPERVIFSGFRKDARRLYGALDIVALTSINEGTPLTLIEAMAAGRPVVSTEVGGVRDIMGRKRYSRDGFAVWDHGITAQSGDVESFARALEFEIDRPDVRRVMGERGRMFVTSGFSRERLVRDIETLYSELAGFREAAPKLPSTGRDRDLPQAVVIR